MKQPTIKHYADYFAMGLQLGICSHTELITWADKLIEKIDRPSDWTIDLSTDSQKHELDVVRILNSVPGVPDLEVSFRLLIAKLALVKPVLYSDNGFIEAYDSRLFSNLYFMARKQEDRLPDCIKRNIFLIDTDMDCVDTGYCDFSVIQQDYQNLLAIGKEYQNLFGA